MEFYTWKDMTWSLESPTIATMVGGPKTFWGDQRAGRPKALRDERAKYKQMYRDWI